MAPEFYLGYRRYCGVVGGRPMTVALTFTPVVDKKPAGCEGCHFYGRGNKHEPYLSTPADYQALGSLSLAEYDGQKETGRWARGAARRPPAYRPPDQLYRTVTVLLSCAKHTRTRNASKWPCATILWKIRHRACAHARCRGRG